MSTDPVPFRAGQGHVQEESLSREEEFPYPQEIPADSIPVILDPLLKRAKEEELANPTELFGHPIGNGKKATEPGICYSGAPGND